MEGRAPGSDYPVGEEKPVPKQESDVRMDGQRADLKRSVPPSASVLVPGSSSDSDSGSFLPPPSPKDSSFP